MKNQTTGKSCSVQNDSKVLRDYFAFASAIFIGTVLSLCLFLLFLRHNAQSREDDFRRWAEMKTAAIVYATEDIRKFFLSIQTFYAASEKVSLPEFQQFSSQILGKHGIVTIMQISKGQNKQSWHADYYVSEDRDGTPGKAGHAILNTPEIADFLGKAEKNHSLSTSHVFSFSFASPNSPKNSNVVALLVPLSNENDTAFGPSPVSTKPAIWALAVLSLPPLFRDSVKWNSLDSNAVLKAYVLEDGEGSFLSEKIPDIILGSSAESNASWEKRITRFSYSTTIPLGSRRIFITIEPIPGYVGGAVDWSTWTVLSLGLLLTGMLGAVLYQQTSRHIEARAQVQIKSRALLESESLYRTVLENTVDGIITIDEDGIVTTYNPACTLLFGYKPEEVIGHNVNMLMPDPDKSNHDGYIKRYLRTGEAKIIGIGREVRGQRKNGDIFPMELSIGEVQQDDAHLFVGIARDITARKEAEEALNQSNAALDDFVYIVSHDLKEPLRGVRNYSRFLAEDHADKLDSDGKEKLETLERLARRMEEQINSLLAYSRANRAEITCETIDPRKIVADIIDSFQIKIAERNATIIAEKNFPTIICNAACLHEILGNLIGNALKYNDSPMPTIIVGYEGKDSRGDPVLFVRDNGIGIREEHQAVIFNMFKRLHTTDRYGGGTGSGLAIVRKLVERHGGKIRVESIPGQGSTFFFTLKEGKAGKYEHAA